MEETRVFLHIVSLAAVFSLVTQRSSLQEGGVLRDESKNGCEGDYHAQK